MRSVREGDVRERCSEVVKSVRLNRGKRNNSLEEKVGSLDFGHGSARASSCVDCWRKSDTGGDR